MITLYIILGILFVVTWIVIACSAPIPDIDRFDSGRDLIRLDKEIEISEYKRNIFTLRERIRELQYENETTQYLLATCRSGDKCCKCCGKCYRK